MRDTLIDIFFFSLPESIPATTAAQAHVPHASVSPAPLSQTCISICVGDIIDTNSTFTFFGNIFSESSIGLPYRGTAKFATSSSRNMTACGLPMLTGININSRPSEMTVRIHFVTGMRSSSVIGAPISTMIFFPSVFSIIFPFAISTWTSDLSVSHFSWIYWRKHRAPLPHISTSDPS